ncbi:MAG TPA: twin-arginine translocase TatA/TatE family subunit [Solirubrobacterales bacterium]|jgi:sec-independent protein translocase protein TatA|nr:twin-arginine translocase TatA/TatE family subunit [Solirubrobacterales bacterium]
MPFNIGPLELIVVLIIALIVFGPKRLPELGRSLGKGIREFRGSVSGEKGEDEEDTELRELQQSKAKAEADAIEAVEGEVVADKRS